MSLAISSFVWPDGFINLHSIHRLQLPAVSYKLRISRIFLSVFIHNADDLFIDSKLWILLNPVTDLVQKHSETALDTPRKEGTESSFPVKMHLIVLHKACLSVKFHDFTDKLEKMNSPIRKIAGFTDDLKKPVLIAPLRGANVLQNPKEKSQILEIKDLRFKRYPVDYLFSNQFMEDLTKIYRLRKYFPSFDDDVCQSPIPSSDDSGL